ncbi:hypothetical protein AQI88_25410 [Streptomyces cellostaticus]|uniref:Uncharacterized protein n=1 Tax=Streptomyces cellostaticus TaxID=67285 RepID=A0A101NID8_9ACTN|nr:hypothetical protein [Streptomyces cellostaticus]KUM93745.1 hypothetical protein AQI88_25410 [Streptomyces cellostaticus]GHI07657.1 hypothetical protein Scel_59780 [Streptomyces cellostaticus]
MKRALRLGACLAAVLAGAFVPAAAAQAAPATTTATADYVCEGLVGHGSISGLWLEGTNCHGPTGLAWENRTITTTSGGSIWQCVSWSYRPDEFGPVKASGCKLAG